MDNAAERRRRLLESLARRGLLADGAPASSVADVGASNGILSRENEPLTKWGQPAWRPVLPAGKPGAPEALAAATAWQVRVVDLAYAVPQTGENACAAWIEAIWARLGIGIVSGHACDLYERYGASNDLAQLKVGMIVAVPATPYSADGLRYGHVGLYAGDNMIMDCAASQVRHVPLDLWLSTYGVMAEPRWGWLAFVDLGR